MFSRSSSPSSPQPTNLVWRRVIVVGSVAGLIGGVAFAAWAGLAGAEGWSTHTGQPSVLLQIAYIVRSKSPVVGLLLHLLISALLGVCWALLVMWRTRFTQTSRGGLLLASIVYGGFWWFLGSLTLLPLLDGVGVRWSTIFSTASLSSLVGHLIFGLALGIVLVAGNHRIGAGMHEHATARKLTQ